MDFTSLALALEIDVSWKTTLLHSSFINVQFAPIQKATVKEGVTFVFVFVFAFVIVFVLVIVFLLVRSCLKGHKSLRVLCGSVFQQYGGGR